MRQPRGVLQLRMLNLVYQPRLSLNRSTTALAAGHCGRTRQAGVQFLDSPRRWEAAFRHLKKAPARPIGSPVGSACYFLIIIVIRHETTAAARWLAAADEVIE
jgi:hypothetical protein